MRLLPSALMMLCCGLAWAQETPPLPEQVLDAAVNQVIRPAMAQFKREASGLESAMMALCALPSRERLDIAAGQFMQAAEAYGAIEMLRLGPLMEHERAERLMRWPALSTEDIAAVEAVLDGHDAAATQVMALADQAPAVQGLGALDLVLFGEGAASLTGPDGAFRCAYGRAIADNISNISDELAMGWYAYDGVASHLSQPRGDYADYRTEAEAVAEMAALVREGIAAVERERLLPLVAEARGEALPVWTSRLGLPLAVANVRGLERLTIGSGLAGLAAQDAASDGLALAFQDLIGALDQVERGGGAERKAELEAALAASERLAALLDAGLGPLAGVGPE